MKREEFKSIYNNYLLEQGFEAQDHYVVKKISNGNYDIIAMIDDSNHMKNGLYLETGILFNDLKDGATLDNPHLCLFRTRFDITELNKAEVEEAAVSMLKLISYLDAKDKLIVYLDKNEEAIYNAYYSSRYYLGYDREMVIKKNIFGKEKSRISKIIKLDENDPRYKFK